MLFIPEELYLLSIDRESRDRDMFVMMTFFIFQFSNSKFYMMSATSTFKFHNKHQVIVSANVQQQQELVKQYMHSIIGQIDSNNKPVIIGFSGGSMPPFLAPLLAELPNEIANRLNLFPVDERLLPIENEESNAGSLLRLLPAKKFKIQSVPGTLIDDGCQAAKEFEKQLRSLDPPINAHGFPVFDLLFLGLGPDGHTCSLFPGHPLLNEDTVWISHLDNSPKPPPRRITVTMPVLNAARNVAFIANGAGKAETIRAIVAENNQHYPPSQIQRTGQQEPIQWFIDEPAAGQIVAEEQKL